MPELVPYAVSERNSRGREHADGPHLHRNEFQRDRDRIVHSTAFRRLEYKTQVFVNHEGDHFRTRLTHSLEVAQIARSIARALNLNEDLAEAISLAHDLGHTPFGHAGQDALNDCMRNHGGFEHNLQSLRIVDRLEERYAAFDGLNLCYETREGILKHCSLENARRLGPLGERFLNRTLPSLEAQVCNVADEIAYNNHDLDDGLRSGLILPDQVEGISLFATHAAVIRGAYPGIGGRRLVNETIRSMINALVCDLIETTALRISERNPRDVNDVRLGSLLVGFSEKLADAQREVKQFLRRHLYQHFQVLRMTSKAQRIVADLFAAFMSDRRLLPQQFQAGGEDDEEGEESHARRVADYIAGMTDRYAIKEHRRLYAVGEI